MGWFEVKVLDWDGRLLPMRLLQASMLLYRSTKVSCMHFIDGSAPSNVNAVFAWSCSTPTAAQAVQEIENSCHKRYSATLITPCQGCLIHPRHAWSKTLPVFWTKSILERSTYVENLCQIVGHPWEQQIVMEVKRSNVFVVILTPAFSQRFWPMYELYLALEAAEQQPLRQIVPVLYGTTYVDLRQNFERFNALAEWEKHANKDLVIDVVESCVKNLNTLSRCQSIEWDGASPLDKKS